MRWNGIGWIKLNPLHHPGRPPLLLLLLSGETVENLFEGDLAERIFPDAKLGGIVLAEKGREGRKTAKC